VPSDPVRTRFCRYRSNVVLWNIIEVDEKKSSLHTTLATATGSITTLKPRLHSPSVRPDASRQFVAGELGRPETNREGIWVRSYIPGSATDQTRFVTKCDHGLSRLYYGLRRYIPVLAPEALPCVPVHPDTPRLCPGHRRQSPNVTTASHGRRTAKPRCYTEAYK